MSNDLTTSNSKAYGGSPLMLFLRLQGVAILLGAGLLGLIAAAGCGHRPPDDRVVSAGYLGNAACAPCHSAEFNAHHDTHHAATMRAVDRASMGTDWPAPGPVGNSGYALYKNGAGLAMGWQNRPASALPMNFALGSARFAYTFVAIADNQSIIELPESYFRSAHGWLPTPGQEITGQEAMGVHHDDGVSRHCLGCHTTALPDNGITPEPRFFGVGCESCHGPGKQHVEAVHNGDKTDLQMAKLSALSATKLNTLCGRCHRVAEDVPPDQTDMTQRFESYGLMKSRCFRESGATLSCVTCHDAHRDASSDQKDYERVCKSCHVPSEGFGPVQSRGKPCPVNPRSGCIPCHMPKRKITEETPIAMSDHDIRVFEHPETQSR